jgi:predicted small lipoprotein YifL
MVLISTRQLGGLAALVVFTVCLSGCGPAGPKTYPVKGKLTINGQAPKDVNMAFYPVGANLEAAGAEMAADGSYTLKTGREGKAGAMAGDYKVVLSQNTQTLGAGQYKPGAEGGAPNMQRPSAGPLNFPERYLAAATSDKTVTVKAGDNTINIDITD